MALSRTLVRPDTGQQRYDLREVAGALCWIVRAGAPWRLVPHEFPPWEAGSQRTQRWLAAGCLAAMVHNLPALLHLAEGRGAQPAAVSFDNRTLPSTPERGHRAGYDGAKRRRGSKLHVTVDTLGHLLALAVTPADAQDRAQVSEPAAAVQAATGEQVELASVDQGYTGEQPAADATDHGIHLEVVKLPEARRGFVLLPRRWVVERSFAWLSHFRQARPGLRAAA